MVSAKCFDSLDHAFPTSLSSLSPYTTPSLLLSAGDDGDLLALLAGHLQSGLTSNNNNPSQQNKIAHTEQPPFIRTAPADLDAVRKWSNSKGKEWEWRWCPRCAIWSTSVKRFHQLNACAQRKVRLAQSSQSSSNSSRSNCSSQTSKKHLKAAISALDQTQLAGLVAHMLKFAVTLMSADSSRTT